MKPTKNLFRNGAHKGSPNISSRTARKRHKSVPFPSSRMFLWPARPMVQRAIQTAPKLFLNRQSRCSGSQDTIPFAPFMKRGWMGYQNVKDQRKAFAVLKHLRQSTRQHLACLAGKALRLRTMLLSIHLMGLRCNQLSCNQRHWYWRQ